MHQWLDYLARYDRPRIKALYAEALAWTRDRSRAAVEDPGTVRRAVNYAAVLLAWKQASPG